jgi:hypothetical protein
MKPTQEQIEAALRYATRPLRETNESDIVAIQSYDTIATTGYAASQILAAAYREAIAENERLQGKLSAANLIAAIDERGEKPSCDF